MEQHVLYYFQLLKVLVKLRVVQFVRLLMQQELKIAGMTTSEETLASEQILHESRIAALNETFEAEMRLAELRNDKHGAEVLGLQQQIELRNEDARHANSNSKLQDKLNNESLAKRKATSDAVVAMAGTTAQALDAAARLGGENEQAFAMAAAVAKGVHAMAVGAQVTAEGIANVASFNYAKGVPQIAAGALNVAVGGMLMAGDIMGAAGKVGGGGVGAGGRPESSGGFGPRGGTGNSSQSIPASPNGGAPGGTQPTSGGGGNNYTVYVNQTGAVDQDSAMSIAHALEELDYSRGSVSA